MLLVPASQASAEYSTDNFRSAADASAAILAHTVNSANVCDVRWLGGFSDEYHQIVSPLLADDVPIEVGCSGSYNIEANSGGATAEADIDVFACVGTSCVVVPATLNRTGGFVYLDGRVKTGETTLATLPKVCVSGICATEEPQPIQTVDPNNYIVELFTAADEVEVYHPFASDPIVLQVGEIVIDGGGGSDG